MIEAEKDVVLAIAVGFESVGASANAGQVKAATARDVSEVEIERIECGSEVEIKFIHVLTSGESEIRDSELDGAGRDVLKTGVGPWRVGRGGRRSAEGAVKVELEAVGHSDRMNDDASECHGEQSLEKQHRIMKIARPQGNPLL